MLIKILKITVIILLISFLFVSSISTTLNYRDFVKLFYLAGKLVNCGQISILYSTFDIEHGFFGSFFNYQHNYFENFKNLAPEKVNCPFFYMPLIAYLMAPFALLNYRISFILWLTVNITLFFVSLFFISKYNSSKSKFKWIDYSFDAFIFLPFLWVFYVGQTSFILGILPIVIGLYFWLNEKPIKASLSWSCAFLKFQFLFIPIFFLIISILCNNERKKSFQSLVVILISSSIILSSNIILFGMKTFLLWAKSLKYASLLDILLYMKNYKHGFTSLYFCIYLETKVNPLFINCIIFLLFIIIIISLTKIFSKIDLNDKTNKILLFTVSSFAFFILSPHSLYYDLALLIFSFIIFDNQLNQNQNQEKHLKAINDTLKITLIYVNIYGLCGIIYSPQIHSTILMIPYLIVFIYILFEINKYSNSTKILNSHNT